MTNKPRSKLSEEFFHLKTMCHGSHITLEKLFEGLSQRSHALPILVFSLPFFLPIPMPGLSVVLGIVVMTSSAMMMIGKKPWYPRVWSQRKISTETLNKIFEKGIWIGGWIEKITVPNAAVIVPISNWLQRITAVGIFICAFLLALPLPPGTNFPPATAIFTLALGLLEANLLLLSIGFLLTLFNIFFFWELFLLAGRAMTGLINS